MWDGAGCLVVLGPFRHPPTATGLPRPGGTARRVLCGAAHEAESEPWLTAKGRERTARAGAGRRSGCCRHLDAGQNQWYHFGVGAPPILVYFGDHWDVHWGYGLLTHSQFFFDPTLVVQRKWEQSSLSCGSTPVHPAARCPCVCSGAKTSWRRRQMVQQKR